MAMIDRMHDAVDDFGMITSAEARELGLGSTELVQQARRGKLVRAAAAANAISTDFANVD